MVFPGFLPKFHGSSIPPLPTTGLTAHFDFSTMGNLYKTFTIGNDPSYTDVATADADVIQVARSVFPVSTSDFCFGYTDGDATKSPVFRLTTPLLGAGCLDFDGSNDRMFMTTRNGTFVAGSGIFGAGAKTILVAFRCESLPSSGALQPLLMESSNFLWGISVYDNAGTVVLLGNNHDGNYDNCFGPAISVDTNYVGVYRHDGTNIYVSINGGSETSAPSGNTSDLSFGVFLGSGASGPTFNGRIGEIATYNAALTGIELSDAIASMMSRI